MTGSGLNCWEFMRCGREPGGAEAERLGPCPAATDRSYHGLNEGLNGGRICWAVAGTCCGGKVQGTFAEKRSSCVDCDFFKKIHQEQREAHPSTKLLKILCDEDHSALLRRLSYRHIRQGERFISQGEISDCAFIIETGSCLLVVEKHGALHPVDHRGEGDIVGELSILTGEPQNAHVEAQTDMGVWVLDRFRFQDLSGSQPELLDFLTELVADRLDSKRPIADRRIGKYIATDIIGRGGYSIVYKGRHSHLDMEVAIKMLKLDMALRKDFLSGFWNEARTIGRLNHDNIVRVFDIEERYRTLFIIMEYLRGESLAQLLERSGRLASPLATHLLRQLCDGLEYAHGHGLIHGDINPSNVTVCDGRRLKILDFGLSCPVGCDELATFGTVAYSAPELIVGEPVDQRTDIYAMGIMAYEMVTGSKPFPDEDLCALMRDDFAREVPDPAARIPALEPALRRFILRATRRDPAARYQNMAEARRDLPVFSDSLSVPIGSVVPGTRERNAIEILVEEHALIRRFLDCLVLALEHLDEGVRIPPDFFLKAVRFARDFADRYHHVKEELYLFAHVAQKADEKFVAPCEGLRMQHECGRNHIVEAAGAIDDYTQGSHAAAAQLAENLHAYVTLLRRHIHAEDFRVFPMISQWMTEADDRAMRELYRQEEARFGEGFAARCRTLVDEMGVILQSTGTD